MVFHNVFSILGRIAKTSSKIERSPKAGSTYLVSPIIDFLALGGGSLVFLLSLKLWDKNLPQAAALSAALSFVINYPHFAHSYQVFYRNFHIKLFTDLYPYHMRARFFIAGALVPLAFATFFSWSILKSSPIFLGYTVNVMFGLVGWHYVKQGYGALMLCAVRRKQFFSELDKKILLVNAFIVWAYAWSRSNTYSSHLEYWSIPYHTVALPEWVLQVLQTTLAISSLLSLGIFLRKGWGLRGKLPWNGIVAYLCALYVWTAFVNVLHQDAFFFIPAFHSLQYLIMVWKYEDNKARIVQGKQTLTKYYKWLQKYWFIVPLGFCLCIFIQIAPQNWVGSMQYEKGFLFSTIMVLLAALFLRRIFIFIASGVLLGILGFWLVPVWLQSIFTYNQQVFGGALFLFMAWIFINVHHYFMDSVIWRKENADVGRYLFQSESSDG